jgi:hypothetical protein
MNNLDTDKPLPSVIAIKVQKIIYIESVYHYFHPDLKLEIDFIIHSSFHLFFWLQYFSQ